MTMVHNTARALAAAGTGLALLASPGFASAEMAAYELDSTHTVVAFMVSHIGYAKALGRFSGVEGSFRFDEESKELADLSVTIPTETVDLGGDGPDGNQGGQSAEDREGHVKSEDFLNVSAYPEITFEMTGAEQTGDRTGIVRGDLTLLGETREVALDVTLNKIGEYPFGGGEFSDAPYVVGVSARGQIERSDWGMSYGTGNGAVGDTVDIIIEMEARRQ